METVKVSTITYSAFIKTYTQIEIPDYQRPYCWDKGNVDILLSDLKMFFTSSSSDSLDYYMGSILLYKGNNEKAYQVIDGQQRLTTLNLIYYVLNKDLLEGQNLVYNNHLSYYHIKKNKAYLETCISLLTDLKEQAFFDKLIFTLIETEREDHSFAFFDSQNNRGVSLATEDYLKAYHLREVASEQLQSNLAIQWEQAAIKAQIEQHKEMGLGYLFYEILYRAREWKGQKYISPADENLVLDSFKKKTIKTSSEQYPLFGNKNNRRFLSVSLIDDKEHRELANDEASLGRLFSLRQPIYKGLNFFQFTHQYYEVLQDLFDDKHKHPESISKAKAFYNAIYAVNMSAYLRHYMQLCLVMYYDVFGTEEIDKAIQYFDYFIGDIRITKYYVRQESVKNSLMYGVSNNLLDVIAHAYLPSEVFDFIANEAEIRKRYAEEKLSTEQGVRSNYKKRVIDYYFGEQAEKPKFLHDRIKWIK